MYVLHLADTYIGITTAAAIASWVILHRRTVCGDSAICSYTVAYLALYLALHAFPPSPSRALSTATRISLTYPSTIALVTVTYRLSPWHSLRQSPWLLHILRHIPATKDMHQLIRLASQMTRKRIQTEDLPEFRDLMSYLIEGGVELRDMERDAVIAVLGGSDNTTLTMSLICYFLVASKGRYHKLRHELEQAFPGPLGPLLTAALAPLPYLNAVTNEALRLGSPFFLPRIVPPGGTKMDGRHIPEGTVVAHDASPTSPRQTHRSPTLRAFVGICELRTPGTALLVKLGAALRSFGTNGKPHGRPPITADGSRSASIIGGIRQPGPYRNEGLSR